MQRSSESATARGGDTGGAAVRSSAGGVRSRCQDTTVYDGRQGPKYGKVSGDTWRKAVRGSVHRRRTPPSWCMDTADLDAAEALGVRLVLVHDLETLRKYYATPATIRRRGFVFDLKYGEQVGLALEHWRGTPQEALDLAPKPEPETTGPVQLGLFGGAL